MKNKKNIGNNREAIDLKLKEQAFGLFDNSYDDYVITSENTDNTGKISEEINSVYFKLDEKLSIKSNNSTREIEVVVVSEELVDKDVLHKLLMKL